MFGAASPFGGASSPFGASGAASNPFGANSTTTPFGQPSNPFGASSSPFGGSSPFGQAGQPAGGSVFGSGTATGVFGVTQPAFGASPAPAFGTTSVFGQQKPAGTGFGAFGTTTPGQANPFGASTFGQPSQPAFNSQPFGATNAFGSATPSAFGSTPSSAFGAPASTPAFGQASSTPAFGATPSIFGSQTPAFGQAAATPAPAFGTTTSVFGSTPAAASPFGAAATPAFGAAGAFGAASPFGAQKAGSRAAPYAVTPDTDSSTGGVAGQAGKFVSISAMPAYRNKSVEELRWEDYQAGDKGGPAPAQAGGSIFGQPQQASPFGAPVATPAFGAAAAPSPFGQAASQPSLFGGTSTLAFGQQPQQQASSAFGQSQSAPAFGSSPSPFGQPATSLFGQVGAGSTPAFGQSSTPAFGQAASTPAFGSAFGAASTTPAFGATTSLFGTPQAQPSQPAFGGFGATAGAAGGGGLFGQPAAGAGATSAFGQAASSSAFGGSSLFGATPQQPQSSGFGFGQSSMPAFGSSTPAFGAASTTPSFGGGGLFGQSTGAAGTAGFGFGQTKPAGLTQSSPMASFGGFGTATTGATPSSFSFGGLGASQPGAAGSMFGAGATSGFGASMFGQPAGAQATAAGQVPTMQNPFGTMPAMPQISIGRTNGSTPAVQYGISTMPQLSERPVQARTATLLTPRHITPRSKVRMHARRYNPKKDSPKVSFFSDADDVPGTLKADVMFVPRENPRALFIRHPEPLPLLPLASPGSGSAPGLGGSASPEMMRDGGTTPVQNGKSKHADNGPTGDYSSPSPQQQQQQQQQQHESSPSQIPRHEAEKAAITYDHGAPISDLMPKLRSPDYYTEPRLQELAAKERAGPGYCKRVRDFVVGRRGYGQIRWLGETDVRKLDLEAIVQLSRCEVLVYMDEERKPRVGEGLNKPAEVTLLNVKCVDKRSGQQVLEGPELERFEKKLRKKTEEQGAEFLSYDALKSEWKFRVEHFSRYGLDDLLDDEDDSGAGNGSGGAGAGGVHGGAGGRDGQAQALGRGAGSTEPLLLPGKEAASPAEARAAGKAMEIVPFGGGEGRLTGVEEQEEGVVDDADKVMEEGEGEQQQEEEEEEAAAAALASSAFQPPLAHSLPAQLELDPVRMQQMRHVLFDEWQGEEEEDDDDIALVDSMTAARAGGLRSFGSPLAARQVGRAGGGGYARAPSAKTPLGKRTPLAPGERPYSSRSPLKSTTPLKSTPLPLRSPYASPSPSMQRLSSAVAVKAHLVSPAKAFAAATSPSWHLALAAPSPSSGHKTPGRQQAGVGLRLTPGASPARRAMTPGGAFGGQQDQRALVLSGGANSLSGFPRQRSLSRASEDLLASGFKRARPVAAGGLEAAVKGGAPAPISTALGRFDHATDAALFLGHSFRVGWGPNGLLLHPGTPVSQVQGLRLPGAGSGAGAGAGAGEGVAAMPAGMSSVVCLERVAFNKALMDSKGQLQAELVQAHLVEPLLLHMKLSAVVQGEGEAEQEAVAGGNKSGPALDAALGAQASIGTPKQGPVSALLMRAAQCERTELPAVCEEYSALVEKEAALHAQTGGDVLVLEHQRMVWDLTDMLFGDRLAAPTPGTGANGEEIAEEMGDVGDDREAFDSEVDEGENMDDDGNGPEEDEREEQRQKQGGEGLGGEQARAKKKIAQGRGKAQMLNGKLEQAGPQGVKREEDAQQQQQQQQEQDEDEELGSQGEEEDSELDFDTQDLERGDDFAMDEQQQLDDVEGGQGAGEGQVAGPDEEAKLYLRRAEFSVWLQGAVAHVLADELASLPQGREGGAGLRAIFAHLTGRQLEEAVVRAIESGDVRLAMLLSQAGASVDGRADVACQLAVWEREGVLDGGDLIEEERVRIMRLLAGDVQGAVARRHLDWKRFLGLVMWYQLPANVGLPEIVEQFQELVNSEKAPAPIPMFVEEGPQRGLPGPQTEAPFDTCYYLMLLHKQEAERQVARADDAARMLRTSSSTHDWLDARLGWHLHQLLLAIGLLPVGGLYALHMDFAAQLLAAGQCHLAIYVILHMPPSPAHPGLREKAVREILELYCDTWASSEEQRTFLEADLGVPSALLHAAEATLWRFRNNAKKELEHLLKSDSWQRAHVGKVASALLALQPHWSTIDNWAVGGQVLLDFVSIRDSFAAAASGSGTDASASSLATVEGRAEACERLFERIKAARAIWKAPEEANLRCDTTEGELHVKFAALDAPLPGDARACRLQDAVSSFTCWLSETAAV
eukprot:jgi/Mesen1/7986/ME000425S07193